MVSSDFGRTPRYNDGMGKDHWPITSVLMMGGGVQGNRVIGATDDGVYALPVNSQTLELDPTGEKIQPAHLHASLRARFGVNEHRLSAHYPILSDPLPIFG